MKKLSGSQIETEIRLAGEAFKGGDLVAGLARFDSVLRSKPDSAVAHLGKGGMLMALQRPADALASFKQVLQFDPNNVQALRWAAELCLNLRLPDQTEGYARRLTRIQPKNDRAFFLLSVALSLSGRWLDALDAINSAIALQPTSLDYIVEKAQSLAKLHLHSLAIEWYRKALVIRPVPQFAFELADLLLEESQPQEAISLLERYTSELPPEGRPNALMARAYTESQRYQEAHQYWASAVQFSTDHAGLVAVRAKSEILSGRLQVAEELLRNGLERDPSTVELFGLLAQITDMSGADQKLIEDMEEVLTHGQSDPRVVQILDYALGKSYHDLGDYERAMSFYDDANRLRGEFSPNRLKFDREKWKGDIDFHIEFFTKERVGSFAEEGLDSSTPLLVVGMIRSGTTLCEHILSCHSMIQDGGEQTFWADRRSQFLDRRAARFDMTVGRLLGRRYLQILDSKGSDATYVIDKNPLNVLLGSAIHCIYPNAKMIHVKRHAVDNLLSIWMTPMATGLQYISTREDLVFAYRQYLRLVQHLEQVLPEDRFRTFTYEEITTHPEPTTEGMLRYLELDTELACFHPETNLRTVRTPSMYQVRQPINTNSQAKWKLYEPWLGAFEDLL